MKFSTGSSSSSLASDSLSRKSTLCIYTEVDAPAPCEKMDSGSEAMELRRELDAVRSALQQQSESVLKQRHQLVEAGHALAARDHRAAHERRLRQDQLALVLRSLVLLESRLTREQSQIKVALVQKEKIIKLQHEEIIKLKARKAYCSNCQQLLGFTSEQTNIETDPEFQSLESTDSRYQNSFARSCSYRERIEPSTFQKNTRLSKSFQLPKNDVVYGNTSSSEEGNNSATVKGTYVKNKQAFVRKDVIRRSRKFSGRKNNNTYIENSQKRYSSQANSSSAEECVGMSYQVNNDNDHTANQIASDIKRASLKIDQLIEENTKADYKKEADKTYAGRIESLHGIKRQSSEEINANRTIFLKNVLNEDNHEKPWYLNTSDPEPETEGDSSAKAGKLNYVKSKSADNLLLSGFNDGILTAEVISAKNEVLCNSIMKNVKKDRFEEAKIYDERNNNMAAAFNEKQSIESAENWYASASDQDDGPSCEIYKNNPVLECVNQILLQNSLDDSSNDNSKSSDIPSPKASTKRVQFSTLNSISYDDTVGNNGQSHTLPRHDRRSNKIVKFSLETASEHSYEVPNTAQGFHYEIQSIYSNDYEPIITKSQETLRPVPLPRAVNPNFNIKNDIPSIKGSIVKNIAASIENKNNATLYMDSDKKTAVDVVPMKIVNKRKVPRTPPALPPKPKNLVSKFKIENNSTVSPSTETLDSDTVAANQRIAEVKTRKVGQVATLSSTVEPDYCSISEINVPVVSKGKRELLLTQPTIEIHNEQYASHPINQKNSIAKVVSLSRIQNKISDKDIPKLPQVTEILIPDEDESKVHINCLSNTSFPPGTHGDNYLVNKPYIVHSTPPKLDSRNSIQMGNTISNILSEINRGGRNGEKHIILTDLDNQYSHNSLLELNSQPNPEEFHKAEYFDDIDKFDLSQNFEEFKIDDELGSIVAEEYRISSGSSDGSASEMTADHVNSVPENHSNEHNIITNNVTVARSSIKIINMPETMQKKSALKKDVNSELLEANNEVGLLNSMLTKAANKMSNKPDLLSNIDNVETESVRNSDIESSNSSGSNSGSYNTVKCEPVTILNNIDSCKALKRLQPSFDFFLESSGLSSKSIVTPTKGYMALRPNRPPSANHKNVLKPKDIKMRVKNPATTNKINEKPMTTAIKYFEPYL